MQHRKHTFVYLNKDADRRRLQEGEYTHAVNKRVGSAARKGAVENVKGNKMLSGVDYIGKAVGAYEDTDRVILFHETADRGRISVLKSNEIVQTVVDWAGYTFGFVTSIGMVEDMLYWTDKTGAHSLNVTRNIYNNSPAQGFSLIKAPPLAPPLTKRKPDSSFSRNLISAYNFQFAYRYVYKDNEKSVFSPLSKVSVAETIPNVKSLVNTIEVTYQVEGEVLPFIKEVELAYRIGNVGDYYIFDINKSPKYTNVVNFYNDVQITPVSEEESSKLFEPVDDAETITAFKDRVFTANLTTGFEQENSFITVTSVISGDTKPCFKHGGNYGLGIAFYDKFGRTNGVVYEKSVNIPDIVADIDTGYAGSKLVTLKVKTSGDKPTWAERFQIVMTKERNYQIYAQYPVNVLYYVADKPDFEDYTPADTQTIINDRVYLKSPGAEYNFTHLQFPNNTPFMPDKECFIKLLNKDMEVMPVIDVVGDMIVTNKLNTQDTKLFIEVYKPKKTKNQLFFEIGESHPMSEWGKEIPVTGDNYRIQLFYDITKYRYSDYGTTGLTYTLTKEENPFIISPTPNFDNTFVNTDAIVEPVLTGFDVERSKGFLGIFNKRITSIRPMFENTVINAAFTLNYANVVSDWGRPLIKMEGARRIKETTTIRFSNTYVQGSGINGLSTFNILDSYVLPTERTPIRKLQPAGDVLLCFHEKNVTSLYVGEGFIKVGDNGEEILSKTRDVIGADRQLEGGYGTIHPESVVEYKGRVYWWDDNKRTVCRYTREGIYPLSKHHMENHFRQKSYKNQRVIGVIDQYYNQYILIFPDQVIAFNITQERWESFYTWQNSAGVKPEMAIKLDDRLYSFLDKRVWKHHDGAYNTFYGSLHNSSIRFVSNNEEGKIQRYVALAYTGTKLSENEEAKVVKCYTEEGQETFIPSFEFRLRENKYYASVFRDIHTPNLPDDTLAFRSGDEMRGETLDVELISEGNTVSRLHDVTIFSVQSNFSV